MLSKALIGLLAVGVVSSGCTDGPIAPDELRPAAAVVAAASAYSGWSEAVRVEDIPGTDPMFNTPAAEGCPFTSRDGKRFFMASTRPGGLGGLDIWISRRESASDPWGEPVNAGAPINSAYNDFCPTLARDGHTFMFVSNRPGGCGGGDIYTSRYKEGSGFDEPQNLGCDVNSAADEQSPFPLSNDGAGPVLYFSSFRPGGFASDGPGATIGDSDIYTSAWQGGRYGPAMLVAGVNTAADEAQPNVSRDGLEMFFYSTRAGTLGGPDIYSATRTVNAGTWSTPLNLGSAVNSAASDSRPSLSWDGTTLYFGSTREGGEGGSDIYVTYRTVISLVR
jgi:hypothetical protein